MGYGLERLTAEISNYFLVKWKKGHNNEIFFSG